MTLTVPVYEGCCGFEAAITDDMKILRQIDGTAIELHTVILEPLQRLTRRAADAGFEMQVVSGFRSFERQLAIWNAKAEGLRPVLDDNNRVVNLAGLSELQRIESIIRFSALPGASRHHWGTDIDVCDGAALKPGQSAQLVVSESEIGGPFYEFHRWLDKVLAETNNEGFFRPYAQDCGGISPEPWHLSYAPMACNFQSTLTLALLRRAIETADICFKETIMQHLESLYKRFVDISWDDYPANTPLTIGARMLKTLPRPKIG